MAPYSYNMINAIEGSYQPSMIKTYNSLAYKYWLRSLYQRMISNIIIDNLPDSMNEQGVLEYLYYLLFADGKVAVFNTEEFGLSFAQCSLTGWNLYYQPTTAIISNPALKNSLQLTIGKDTELIRLTPDYVGLGDIVSYYAEKLATLDNAINVSIINSKVSYVVGAKTKAAAQALKKVIDKMNKGEPAVVYDQRIENDQRDKDTPFQLLTRNSIKNDYITSDLLVDFQTIINAFDAEVGIKTVPYQKAERLVSSEADSKEQDASARLEVWIGCLERSIERVNKLFGTSITVRKREVESNETVSDGDRKLLEQSDSE